MTKLNLVNPTDKILNIPTEIVNDGGTVSGETQFVIFEMKRIALGERDEKHPDLPSLVGLAAPQIGVRKRIILFDNHATAGKANFDVDFRFIINPEIVEISEDEELGREGCYSTGDICGAVYRSKKITVRGFDENGKKIEYKLEGFLARIIQHEIDYLNGVRFPDRIREPEHLHVVKKEDFQNYRENWRTWPNLCPPETWLKMKGSSALM